MKKLISILLILLMLALVFASCNKSDDGAGDENVKETKDTVKNTENSDSNTDDTTADVTEAITDDKTSDKAEVSLIDKVKSEFLEFFNTNFKYRPGENIKATLDDVYIGSDLGQIEQCHIYKMGVYAFGCNAPFETVEVAGLELKFIGGLPTYVYSDGNFYTVNQAYENKLLSDVGVYEFAKRACFEYSVIPSEKDSETIDRELASEIKKAYAEYLLNYGNSRTHNTPSIYTVKNYYGEVEGGHIVVLNPQAVTGTPVTVNVAGYKINYKKDTMIHLYKDGNFYSISEAYEQGILSKDGVYQFAEKSEATIEIG